MFVLKFEEEKMRKRAIREEMGNSGEGKQFKPFDPSGNLTSKLFLEKNKCFFLSFCSSARLRLQKESFLLGEDYER